MERDEELWEFKEQIRFNWENKERLSWRRQHVYKSLKDGAKERGQYDDHVSQMWGTGAER